MLFKRRMETINALETEYFIGCLHVTSGREFEEGKMKENNNQRFTPKLYS